MCDTLPGWGVPRLSFPLPNTQKYICKSPARASKRAHSVALARDLQRSSSFQTAFAALPIDRQAYRRIPSGVPVFQAFSLS
jgi:hypothetical protein